MSTHHTNKKYVIADFEEENCEKGGSMEVILTCWLNDSNEAWWPSHIKAMSRIEKLIRECAKPNESTWEKICIRVLSGSGKR